MNIETTAVFIGHDDCFSLSEHKLRLEIENIINNGIITFFYGIAEQGAKRIDLFLARHEAMSKIIENIK